MKDNTWLKHLDEHDQEVILQIHNFTKDVQLIWDTVIPGKVYTATFRGEILQINCDPMEPGFFIGLEEVKIGKRAIDKLCWAITYQRAVLRSKKGVMEKLYDRLEDKCC